MTNKEFNCRLHVLGLDLVQIFAFSPFTLNRATNVSKDTYEQC